MICFNCATGADLRTAAGGLRLDEEDAWRVMAAVNKLHEECNGCPCEHRIPELPYFDESELTIESRCTAHGMVIPHLGCEESLKMIARRSNRMARWENNLNMFKLVETGIG